MARKLAPYERKRDFAKTPEPAPKRKANRAGRLHRFVIHEHSASRLHWDLRLERDGVLVSWAVPKGMPEEPGENRFAAHTEDHPSSTSASTARSRRATMERARCGSGTRGPTRR